MYGKWVTIFGDVMVFVFCNPETTEQELQELAINKLRRLLKC
jgi:hypothetical protein